MRRVAEGNAGKRRHDAELRDDDPAASPAQRVSEYGRIISIQERRPHELELVGESQLAQEPDGRKRDSDVGQPGRLSGVDEKERDAGPEAQTQRRRDPPVGEQRRPKGRRLRTCDGLLSS
jgi:hypothetical protein